jgi:hypothetical protein
MAASVLKDERARQLVDEFLETYIWWREQSAVADRTYEAWRAAAPEDRGLAFAAYRATLDLEERAAEVHCECSRRLAEFDGAVGPGSTVRAAP